MITTADLRHAKMRAETLLDGDRYTAIYRCVEFPELTRTRYGPNYPATGAHRTLWRVNGDIVSPEIAKIVAAINAHRAENRI